MAMESTLADKLLQSAISKYIVIDTQTDKSSELSSYNIRIQFSSLIRQVADNGSQVSWKLIADKLVNGIPLRPSVKVDYFNGNECLSIAYDSKYKPEYINHFLVSLVQYLQELIVDYQHHSLLKSSTTYKKVLLTGSAGWLGQSAFHHLLLNFCCNSLSSDDDNKDHELIVYGAHNEQIPHWIIPSRRIHFDLTSKDSVYAGVAQVQPDIILHLAAISSPAKCHQSPELASRINCPTVLIDSVNELVPDCLFIFASTDMVYDGEAPPYHVTHSPSQTQSPQPVNVYGETKLAFERIVTSQLKHTAVLRLSNMVGQPYTYQFCGVKFMQFLYDSYTQCPRAYIGLKRDEVRSFVYVQDVNQIITRLVANHIMYTSMTDSSPDTTAAAAAAAERGGERKRTRRENRILNVGGLKGLSRLQVAELMCAALGSACEVHMEKAAADPVSNSNNNSNHHEESKWTVYILPPAVPPPAPSLTAGTDAKAVKREFSSPRDISMSSTDTEVYINSLTTTSSSSSSSDPTSGTHPFRFTPLEECILDCLHVRI